MARGWLLLLAPGLAAAAAGLLAWGGAAGRGDEREGAPEAEAGAPLVREATPAEAPTARPVLVGPDVPARARRERQLLQLARRLDEARALAAEGKFAEALALLAALEADAAQFPDVEDFPGRVARARSEIAAQRGVAELAKVSSGPLARGVARDELQRRIEATREVLARAATEEEIRALERHLRRFLLAQADAASRAGAERAFAAFLKDRGARRARVERPPVEDPEDAERRRIEQLELLRQRGAVGLLDAIHGALAWLALHQADDGTFHEKGASARCAALKHGPACIARGGERWKLGTTALALIAWMDFRDQDLHGLFDPYLALTLEAVRRAQRPDGSFPGSLYEGSIAVMALGQAALSTGRADLREACAAGVRWLERAQARGGGLRYGPNAPAADLSVSAWGAQAVESARAAGVEVPERLLYGFDEFLEWCHLGEHRFCYLDGEHESRSLAPAGMLLMRIARPTLDDALVQGWRKYLGELPVARVPSLYTLYYGVRISILLERALTEPWRSWAFKLADGKRRPDAPGLLVTPGAGAPSSPLVDHILGTLTLEHALYLR